MAHQKERPTLVPLFQPFHSEIGDNVGYISLMLLGLSHLAQDRVMISALAMKIFIWDDVPVVKPRWRATQMPFADDSCLVASFFEAFSDVFSALVQ